MPESLPNYDEWKCRESDNNRRYPRDTLADETTRQFEPGQQVICNIANGRHEGMIIDAKFTQYTHHSAWMYRVEFEDEDGGTYIDLVRERDIQPLPPNPETIKDEQESCQLVAVVMACVVILAMWQSLSRLENETVNDLATVKHVIQ